MTQGQQATGESTVEEVVVTGSFIRRKSQADLPSPISTVGSGDIEDIGAKNIGDITQTLTINTGAQNSPDAFTQGGTTGTSSINLRGLGLSSTLVLLNGKRQVLTATTTNDGLNFVDTSSLVPLIAIDRLEILKDGASATYGSDAVAGVANFITYQDYDGVKLNVNYQDVAGAGNSDELLLQGLFGKDFERGNIMAAIGYLDRSPLTTADKRLSRREDDSSALGNPGAFFGVPGFPATAPVIDPTGCAEVGGTPQIIQATPAGVPDVGLCQFDFGDFFNLIAEEQRINAFVQGNLELTDNLRWSTELSYADTEAERGNSPSFPFLQRAIVSPDNPGNVFAAPVAFFGRASGNGGVVSPQQTSSETLRFSTTLDGNVGESGFWEIAYAYGKNEAEIRTEDTLTDAFQCALVGFNSATAIALGISDVSPTGAREPGCDNVVARGATPGTFFNPFASSFGPLPNQPGLLDFITGTFVRDLTSELQVVEGVYSATLVEMASGPLGYALGFQYRDQSLDGKFDADANLDNYGFLIGDQDYSGDVDVSALFAEVSIPLAAIADLQLAVRYEGYGGEIGSTVDPKIALLLRPSDSISLRGSFSTSFRAPSVFQQIGQVTSLNQVTDPAGGTAFAAVRSFGSEELQPEESEAFNVGLTLEPLEGLKFDVDYWSFDFSDLIIQENFQALVDANPVDTRYDPTDSTRILAGREACARENTIVCRSGDGVAGTILQINSNFVNASSLETSGLDFNLTYTLDTGLGLIRPSIEGTYILDYDLEDPQAGSIDGAGRRNFSNIGTSTPELRINGGLAWSQGAHSANIFVRHVDSYEDDQNPGREVDSQTTVDWRYSLDLAHYVDREQGFAINVGMVNAFDEDPPQVFTNGGFDSKVHDPRGRLLYVAVDFEL